MSPPPETVEQRIAAGRAAVAEARRVLARRDTPTRPDLPACRLPLAEPPPVTSLLPALVASLRAAGVPTVHAALRDWLRGLPKAEQELAVALLAELPVLVQTGGAQR